MYNEREHMTMNRILLTLALASTLCFSSCLAPSNNWKTFTSLTHWNETATDNKWGNEAIFLGLNIIPVYWLARAADVLVFNSIEFWHHDSDHVAK